MNVQGAENERTRQLDRETRERTEAQAAISAGVQNVTSGLSDLVTAGTATMEAIADAKKPDPKVTDTDGIFKTGEGADFSISGGKTSTVPKYDKDLYEINPEYRKWWDSQGYNKKQGGVQKTPGAFSHSTNPIDIMKDGAKIGEMTGGEYIFNPNQAKQLKKLSKSGSSPLHKFVNSLLNKPQFK